MVIVVEGPHVEAIAIDDEEDEVEFDKALRNEV